MDANVLPLARLADAGRLHVAALRLRAAGPDSAQSDLADLLDEVARVVETRSHPPLGDVEAWRWSAVYGTARRIARDWTP